jgi:hypothetical protein
MSEEELVSVIQDPPPEKGKSNRKAKAKPKAKPKETSNTKVSLDGSQKGLHDDPVLSDFLKALSALKQSELFVKYKNVRFMCAGASQFVGNLEDEFKRKQVLEDKQKVVN